MMDLASHLQWREPLWLWLALCPWCLWVLKILLRRSHGKAYADPQLMPWARAQVHSSLWARLEVRRYWRQLAFALAWLLFAMTLAGPRLAKTVYDKNKDQYTELMVVFDLSRSMTARDVSPDRLERARLELEDLIAREQRLKVGLVVYAARPHLLAPPTADKSVLQHDLNILQYGLLPTEGSDLAAAMTFAAKQFTSSRAAHAMLLVTDGGLSAETAESDKRLNDIASQIAQQGVRVYVLGVGTLDGAPLQDANGNWLHYNGKPVVSRLHEDRLKHLVALGDGRYARMSDTDAEWQTLYNHGIHYLSTASTSQNGNSLIEWHELYAWCLIPGILLFLTACLELKPVVSSSSFMSWLAVAVFTGYLHASPAHAASPSWQQSAYRAYQKKSYIEAREDYARVAGYAGRMGEGSSVYRLKQYQDAVRLFTQAILDADNDMQRARAVFNLANCRYRLKQYAEAVALYQQVLLYDAHDRAAKSNLLLAIAMQKRQQQQVGSGLRGRGPGIGHSSVTMNKGSGNLTLGDSKKTKSTSHYILSQTKSSSDLIERGIYESRPVIEQATEFKDSGWKYQSTSPRSIVLQANELKTDQSILWKRIFEGEEGFPAPVRTPQKVPGVLPW